jgi:1-acyl-sn-glycerol-3-phosphate acyltransferase
VDVFYPTTRLVLSPLARAIYRPVVEGRANVPRQGAVILASNHLSFIDSAVIPLVAPRPVTFLAKAEYFTGKGLRGAATKGFFNAIKAIPVERGDNASAQESLDAALAVLKNGDAFGIYPEGTRSRDGRLYRGRTGVAWLALQAQVPVVPVALQGTEQIQPIGSRMLRMADVRVQFGEPLYFADRIGTMSDGQLRRRVTDEIMDAIHALSGQERAPGYNQ